MHARSRQFGLTIVLASALVSAFGVVACSEGYDEQSRQLRAGAEDHDDGDLDPSMPAPDDDPNLGGDTVDTHTPANPEEDDDEEPTADAGSDAIVDAGMPSMPAKVKSPVPGKVVTYPYGVKNSNYAAGYHTGEDYATPTGSKAVAVRSGTIRWSNDNGGAYGKWMGLDADNGRTYVYCHLSSRLFKAGDKVVAGQQIAKTGATGNVTGPHLHFEDHPLGPFKYGQVRKPQW